MKFSEEQLHRYARHIILPNVGGRGQHRLLASRVAVVGAGGLGSPALLYLAAAGVGTIEILDDDVVDLSNLQRQVIHAQDRIGMAKTASARAAMNAINPEVSVIEHRVRLLEDNALGLLMDADLVLDGSDNFATRYLVNDACHFLKKPLVSGAMFQFEGQVAVFPHDGVGPCYRCLFPEPPPPGAVPSCQEAGIFGALCGVVGSIQAVEAIKVLLSIGETLAGRLLLFDALSADFRTLSIRRNEDCALCGNAPSIRELKAISGTPPCER